VPAGFFLLGCLIVWTGFSALAALAWCKHCRSPLGFLMTDWRVGKAGALLMGLKHGAYCTGCYWFLMALLFVAGVMNM
jgi:predicted metal-binding membrane protein